MKVKGTSTASVRTNTNIKKAFSELLSKKQSMKQITVQEIADLAKITRGTFYSHFKNINDVALAIQQDLVDIAKESTEEARRSKNIDSFIDTFIDALDEHKAIYSKIFKTDELTKKIILLGKDFGNGVIDVYSNIIDDNLNNQNRISIEFFTEGAVLMLIRYFRGESNYKLKEIKSFLKEAFKNIIQ